MFEFALHSVYTPIAKLRGRGSVPAPRGDRYYTIHAFTGVARPGNKGINLINQQRHCSSF